MVLCDSNNPRGTSSQVESSSHLTVPPESRNVLFPWRLRTTTAAPSQKTELFCPAVSISGCHSDEEGNAKGIESRRRLCEITHADKNSESSCPSLSSSRDCSFVVQTVGGCFSLWACVSNLLLHLILMEITPDPRMLTFFEF